MKRLLPVFVLMLFVFLAGCKKDDEDNKAPVAAFEWSLTQNPGEVEFTNKSTAAETYEWNYGDGKFSTQENPVHVYDQNGTYIVQLKVFGNQKTDTAKDTLLIDNIP